MATKKFLVSVADVYAYDESDNLLFSSKTLLDSSFEVTLSPTEVRGGRGNQLLYTYYSTGGLNITLNDTQFNLHMLGATVGSGVTTGNDVYTEETVTLGSGGTGTVTGTPIAIQGSTIYGWVTLPSGVIERVTFSGSNFTATGGAENDVVCVRYYHVNASSRSITVPANAIPKIVRLVMEAQLNSSDVGANKIGILQIQVPKFSLSGSFTLSLTSDGVSQTPLSGMAYAFSDANSAACTNEPVYAKLIEILDNANWFDGVVGLSVEGGNFTLSPSNTTKTLVIYAIRPGDEPFIVSNDEFDFTSGTPATATAGLNTGIITRVAAGSTVITIDADDNASLNTTVVCTVSS